MAASLLLLMVPNGLRANAEQTTEITDTNEAIIEETQSNEKAQEVTNETGDFTYDKNNETIEDDQDEAAGEFDEPNFDSFEININTAEEGSFYGTIGDLYSSVEWEHDEDNPQTSAKDPYPQIIKDEDDDIVFDEDVASYWVDSSNYLCWMYYSESENRLITGSIIPTVVEAKKPVWYYNDDPITTDGDYLHDQSYTFTLKYESKEPVFFKATVDLTSEGKLDEEPDSSWNKITGTTTYTKNFVENKKINEIIEDFKIKPQSTSEYHHKFDGWVVSPDIEILTKDVKLTATFTSTMQASVNINTAEDSDKEKGTFDFYLEVDETLRISETNKTSSADTIIGDHSWDENSYFSVDENGVVTYVYWYDEHYCEGKISPGKTIDYKFKSWTLNGKIISCDGKEYFFKDYIEKDADGKIPQFPEFNFIVEFEESSTFVIEGRVSKENGEWYISGAKVSFAVDSEDDVLETVACTVSDNIGWYVLEIPKKYKSGGIVYVDPGEATGFYSPCATHKKYINIEQDLHQEHFKLKQGDLVSIDPKIGYGIGRGSFDYVYKINGKVLSNDEYLKTQIAMNLGTTYTLDGNDLVFSSSTDISNAEVDTYTVTPVPAEGCLFDGWTINGEVFTDGKIDNYDGISFEASFSAIPILTINYIDENGNPVAPTYTSTILGGESYHVNSPSVEGYELVDQTQRIIKGTMPSTDLIINVVYKSTNLGKVDMLAGSSQTGDGMFSLLMVFCIIALAGACGALATRKYLIKK